MTPDEQQQRLDAAARAAYEATTRSMADWDDQKGLVRKHYEKVAEACIKAADQAVPVIGAWEADPSTEGSMAFHLCAQSDLIKDLQLGRDEARDGLHRALGVLAQRAAPTLAESLRRAERDLRDGKATNLDSVISELEAHDVR